MFRRQRAKSIWKHTWRIATKMHFKASRIHLVTPRRRSVTREKLQNHVQTNPMLPEAQTKGHTKAHTKGPQRTKNTFILKTQRIQDLAPDQDPLFQASIKLSASTGTTLTRKCTRQHIKLTGATSRPRGRAWVIQAGEIWKLNKWKTKRAINGNSRMRSICGKQLREDG